MIKIRRRGGMLCHHFLVVIQIAIIICLMMTMMNVPTVLCDGIKSSDDIDDDNDNDRFIDVKPIFQLSKNQTLIEEELGLVLNPSDTCKLYAEKFGEAVSNFTLCSVTNARPIHICGTCVQYYLNVLSSHEEFIDAIDEHGTECAEYYLNLDRIEIVSAAYHYVKSLWKKGNCDYCFEKNATNAKLPSTTLTNDTIRFEEAYNTVKDCFDAFSNDSCIDCVDYYKDLNQIYVVISDTCQDNICLDIVDTMNTTREMWSRIFNCIPVRRLEFGIIFGIVFVGIIPIIFYPAAFLLSKKQEAKVLQQKRLAEVLAGGINSQSTSIDIIGGSHQHLLHPVFLSPGIYSASTNTTTIEPPLPTSRRRATVTF